MSIQTIILTLNKKIRFFCENHDRKDIIILCKIIIDDLINADLKFFSLKFFVKFKHLIFLDQFFSV